jgi:signal transduction histidine kinase
MRERVALYGGSFDVRRDQAGFVVHASLPTA